LIALIFNARQPRIFTIRERIDGMSFPAVDDGRAQPPQMAAGNQTHHRAR